MSYRPHPPVAPRLFGYDPATDLPEDHLARFVDAAVDEHVRPPSKEGPGQPGYDRRMLMKVLLYGYATGVRSSRRLQQNCCESLAYLLLVRDDRPGYRTLAKARLQLASDLEQVWESMHSSAAECGISHLGRVSIDSMKVQADVSPESVIPRKEYSQVREAFRRILEEAAEVDAREEEEGLAVETGTGVPVSRMREVLRRISKEEKQGPERLVPTVGLAKRLEKGIAVLEAAEAADLSYVSLTDPEARMMPLGSSRRVSMGHRFEASADNGLLLVGRAESDPSDNARLPSIVQESQRVCPVEVTQVLADSGFYSGGLIAELLLSGLDVLVPDSTTAGQMRRPEVEPEEPGPSFVKVEGRDAYLCPEGKLLKLEDRFERGGQQFKKYVAVTSCLDCPLAPSCLKNKTAKRRNLTIGEHHSLLQDHLAKFQTPETRRSYYARGPGIETVFSFLKTALGFTRWQLRGAGKVKKESLLLAMAYQTRKLHKAKLRMAAAQ